MWKTQEKRYLNPVVILGASVLLIGLVVVLILGITGGFGHRSHDDNDNQTVTVWFIRHGQAEHNVESNFDIRDPALTSTGIQQSKQTGDKLKSMGVHPSKIFSSPLLRAVQTSVKVFENQLTEKMIYLHPSLQEWACVPCDTGRKWTDLAQNFTEKEQSYFDNELIVDNDAWFQKNSVTEENKEEKVKERFQDFVDYLIKFCRNSDCSQGVAVVAHDGVFHVNLKTSFKNGEFRKYHLQGKKFISV